MRDWRATWRKIQQAPKRDLAYRLAARVRRAFRSESRADPNAPAFAADIDALELSLFEWNLPTDIPAGFQALADAAIEGRFDLLGSGPVNAFRGGGSPGFLGHHYRDLVPIADPRGEFLASELPPGPLVESCRLWQIIQGPHLGIDWGRDMRSGYRWNSKTHHSQIKVVAAPGADLKLPLELGRLQHLPWLALAFARSKDPKYKNALRTHTLDYLAANPPGWGPTWHYAMDAGIRAANVVLAIELAESAKAGFDKLFLEIVARSMVEHGRFIVENLEWHPDRRTNHFLANVAGLAWISTSIPDHEESANWRAYAEWQLGKEVLAQFLPDGGNFEASTGYHRLSLEMALWATARLQACPPRLDSRSQRREAGRLFVPEETSKSSHAEAVDRLASAIRFLEAVTAPDGLLLQIGDHDSGRFFKLDGEDQIERSLDSRGTIDAGRALLLGEVGGINGAVMAELLRGHVAGFSPSEVPMTTRSSPAIVPSPNARTYEWDLGKGVWEGVEAHAFPNFGLFLYRSPRALLAVRCGSVGQAGYGGHAHNDALSLELFCDGKWKIRDPGSFVYTASPEERDRYRSVRAHYAPQVEGREPNPLDAGLFRMPERSYPEAIAFSSAQFVGCHSGYGAKVFRQIDMTETGFVVTDWAEDARLSLLDLSNWQPLPVSLGYGHREGG